MSRLSRGRPGRECVIESEDFNTSVHGTPHCDEHFQSHHLFDVVMKPERMLVRSNIVKLAVDGAI